MPPRGEGCGAGSLPAEGSVILPSRQALLPVRIGIVRVTADFSGVITPRAWGRALSLDKLRSSGWGEEGEFLFLTREAPPEPTYGGLIGGHYVDNPVHSWLSVAIFTTAYTWHIYLRLSSFLWNYGTSVCFLWFHLNPIRQWTGLPALFEGRSVEVVRHKTPCYVRRPDLFTCIIKVLVFSLLLLPI